MIQVLITPIEDEFVKQILHIAKAVTENGVRISMEKKRTHWRKQVVRTKIFL